MLHTNVSRNNGDVLMIFSLFALLNSKYLFKATHASNVVVHYVLHKQVAFQLHSDHHRQRKSPTCKISIAPSLTPLDTFPPGESDE